MNGSTSKLVELSGVPKLDRVSLAAGEFELTVLLRQKQRLLHLHVTS